MPPYLRDILDAAVLLACNYAILKCDAAIFMVL